MDFNYIIVQAGGKGTRLGDLTLNKPKALCSINNLPMIFHLFKKYPDKKFLIIADYKFEVFEKYLETFAKVDYVLIKAEEKGTCSGILESLVHVPHNSPLMVIWSDLILSDEFSLDNYDLNDYIGISGHFECRWSYKNRNLIETPSAEYGVAGLFMFKNKSILNSLPLSGEFVRWLYDNNVKFETLNMLDSNEFGTLSVIERKKKNNQLKSRPFNKLDVKGDLLLKIPLDQMGEKLAIDERNWYKHVVNLGFSHIPKVYDFNPLKIQFIKNQSWLNLSKLRESDKKKIVDNVINTIRELHMLDNCDVNTSSIKEVYFSKTFDRLEKIKNLVPFANKKEILINGVIYKNVFFYKNELRQYIASNVCDSEFKIIHGDTTFSNILLDEERYVYLIDPRGYFGFTKLFGDPFYDWAKFYYSLFGNYDQFNNGNFKVKIDNSRVILEIESNGWEELTKYYLEHFSDDEVKRIKFIHAIIWLSLTTYVWNDYDSICAAFYNGIIYINEFI